MLCAKGGFHWAKTHNSRFETTKLVLINLSQSKSIECPPPHAPRLNSLTVLCPQVCQGYGGPRAPLVIAGQLCYCQSHKVDAGLQEVHTYADGHQAMAHAPIVPCGSHPQDGLCCRCMVHTHL